MAPYDHTTRRIVRTENGPGTCETIYIDQYGSAWITQVGPVVDQTCPPMTGTVIGNVIVTGKLR